MSHQTESAYCRIFLAAGVPLGIAAVFTHPALAGVAVASEVVGGALAVHCIRRALRYRQVMTDRANRPSALALHAEPGTAPAGGPRTNLPNAPGVSVRPCRP